MRFAYEQKKYFYGMDRNVAHVWPVLVSWANITFFAAMCFIAHYRGPCRKDIDHEAHVWWSKYNKPARAICRLLRDLAPLAISCVLVLAQ